jgi:hypothetical protein
MSFMRHTRSYSDMALSRRVMARTAIGPFGTGDMLGQGNGGTTTDGFGRELDIWESHNACQSRRERESVRHLNSKC